MEMAFEVGDRVIYEDMGINGECIEGEIVDIWKNNGEQITNYFVTLDSGTYVQFTPRNLKWSKADESVLIPA
ncbi:MAG: hypothetical protein JSU58_08570 [Dehalococcoidales bacterium]|nr:MAG: hypothetical protein JSU58_08570 [Dehalococcoidales bacterium]